MTARSILLGETVEGGHPVRLDLDVLLTTRMLIQANSGGGKSWTLRRILERSHRHVQQLIIDPEGEFASLREKFPYIVAGRGGDVATEPRIAALLAHRLLELRCSAVLDLYEMHTMRARREFVRLFLEALVNAPKRLWHPVLVVLDECHDYCPEGKEAESSDAVIALCRRGRKRGFAAVLATQRLASLSKDAAAQCENILVGPTTMDNDLKRATLAFALSGGEARQMMQRLIRLGPGEFMCRGRAISREPVLVKVGGCETRHPEVAMGRKTSLAPPPAPEAVKALLPKLSDLPREAEEEAQEKIVLQRRVRELTAEVAVAKRSAAAPAPSGPSEQQVAAAIRKALADQAADWAKWQQAILRAARTAKAVLGEIALKAGTAAQIEIPEIEVKAPVKNATALRQQANARAGGHITPAPPARRLPMRPTPAPEPAEDGEFHLGQGGMYRIVRVLAQRQSLVLTRAQLATLARLTNRGGTYGTYLSRLQRAGLLEVQGNEVRITEAGIEAVGEVPAAPTTPEEHLEEWRRVLGRGPREMLEALVAIYPEAMSREDLAERTGYAASGGTFGTYLSILARNGLVEKTGADVRASSTLFMGAE